MSAFATMRRLALPLAIVVAIVAIAVPTCHMVGCTMNSGAMGFVPFNGPHFSSLCGGLWAFDSAPAGTVPSGIDALFLMLLAAFAGAVALLAPQVTGRPVLARACNPPPPPVRPRGERFRV